MFNNLSQGDLPNFVYLIALLTFLVISIFSNPQNNIYKILKYLAIWAVVGLVIIILYSYRYEFSDFKTRILGEIDPSKVQVSKNGNLIISAAQDGHFYIDVTINNEELLFMIDTGASEIVIGRNHAGKLKIDLEKLLFNKIYLTANGNGLGASVTLNKMKVGDVEFHDVRASINNADMDVSLLGMSFLRRFSKYEFYRDRLILTR